MLENLRASERQLIQSEKLAALGTVVAGVAHELNNPLKGVQNYIQYCAERTDEDDQRHSRLTKALRELKRCDHIIGGMLSYSRSSDRAAFQESGPVDCRSEIVETVNFMAGELERQGIELELRLEEHLPMMCGQTGEIGRVLLNLLTNARDALDHSDHKRIGVAGNREGRMVVISVADTGCGMSPEALEQLFDPFFTTKHFGRGAGLGMPICKNLVEKRGGTIEVQSEPDEGTTVTVRLPVC